MTNELEKTENLLKQYTAELETVNLQIRYTGQYFAHKELYSQFLKSKNKGKFRKEHSTDIQAYEDARDWLKSFYPDGKMHSMNIMKSQKKYCWTRYSLKNLRSIFKGKAKRTGNCR